MKIKEMFIRNLRNHSETTLQFSDGLNIFYGLNGSGKTTILEALSICAFSKSFLPTLDNSLINFNAKDYSAKLNSVNDYGIPYSVQVSYNKGKSKEISSTFGERLKPKEIIGELPCIVLSPDYKAITFGSPQNRRDFVDKLLSQASRKYLDILITYLKALKQRNSLLSKLKAGIDIDKKILDTWTDLLISSGSDIVIRRRDFLYNFRDKFDEIYKYVSDAHEEVLIEYEPNSVLKEKLLVELDRNDVMESFNQILDNLHKDELRRGITLFGPQRDEIKIMINGGISKDIASQGQHKSLLISLKIAEFNYLRKIKNETPIALLDDIFSELDRQRADKVLSLLESNYAQSFITLTDIDVIMDILPKDIEYKVFKLSDGIVLEET